MITRILLICGGALMAAYGIVRLVGSAHLQAVRSAGTWFVGGALAHDLILAPVAIVAGALIVRLVPSVVRPFLQAGLFASAVVTIVALPNLSGRGYSPKLPSALPLDYQRGYLIVLACIWGATVLAGVGTWLWKRTRERTAAPDHR